MVGANSEGGFKQCLPLAYDPDNRKRMIFAHVFARVIGQGTIFESKDKSILKARFQALCDVGHIFSVITDTKLFSASWLEDLM